jgi:O-Antigen ligase
MLTNQRSTYFSLLALMLLIAVATGFAAGANPMYLGLVFGAIPAVIFFFARFEQAVIGLLILRSALDPFSGQQLPAVFAIALNALTILYVVVQLFAGKRVRTDKFWWLFAAWVALQGLWLILMYFGGLGLDASYLSISVREWVRILSWLMIYLLVMQLQDKIHPKELISKLFLALIVPSTVALMQIFVPFLLPAIFVGGGSDGASPVESVSRINGTLGHPNTFATFLILFFGLTLWKLGKAKEKKWIWLSLLGMLAFLYASTKALFALGMLGVFLLVYIAPKLSIPKLVGGVLLFGIAIALFGSTEFGQQRLASLANTPLLNPNIDISRAILLSTADGNSFNWRLAQWTFLLQAWQQHPIFGYGLATSKFLTNLAAYAHNDYVRALAEGGLVGFAAFLLFLMAQLIRLLQLFRVALPGSQQRNLCLVLLAVFAATLMGMLTENIWSHTTLFFYWWTLIAVVGWNWDEKINNDELKVRTYQ